MTRPVLARRAAMILGLLCGLGFFGPLGASARPSCSGEACRAMASAKPLNLMNFMNDGSVTDENSGSVAHEKAARPPKSRRRSHHTAAHALHRHRTKIVHARPKARPEHNAARPRSVAGPDVDVQVVPSDQLNEMDRSAGPAPGSAVLSNDSPESKAPEHAANTPIQAVDASPSVDPSVQTVDAGELNDLDRKAAEAAPAETTTPAVTSPPAHDDGNPAFSTSWLEGLWSFWSSWVWSSLSSALATLRHLFG